MESLIDVEVEHQRLEREIEQNRTLANRLEAKLRNEAFLEKAPSSIINQERQKLASITTRLTQLEEQITIFIGFFNLSTR